MALTSLHNLVFHLHQFLRRIQYRIAHVYENENFKLGKYSFFFFHKQVAGNQALDMSILNFGISLFEALAENDTRNVVVSPIAVQTVLTAMYTGAEDATATELLKGLHFTGVPSTDKIAKQMSQLVAPILISPVIQMSTGIYLNSVYQMQFVWGVEINQQFLTDVEQVNFTDSKATANLMNAYVSNITFDRIENLAQPKWFNSNTSCVLVVAIYVSGPWTHPFDRRMEPNVPFFNDMKSCDKAYKTVNMMHVKVRYANNEKNIHKFICFCIFIRQHLIINHINR